MMSSAASLELRSKWVSQHCRIRRCCERSKFWELASCPLSADNSPQALRVPDAAPVAHCTLLTRQVFPPRFPTQRLEIGDGESSATVSPLTVVTIHHETASSDDVERGVDRLGSIGKDVSTSICPANCYHCYQIDLYFSVRDDLGLTRRYSKSSGEVLTNS